MAEKKRDKSSITSGLIIGSTVGGLTLIFFLFLPSPLQKLILTNPIIALTVMIPPVAVAIVITNTYHKFKERRFQAQEQDQDLIPQDITFEPSQRTPENNLKRQIRSAQNLLNDSRSEKKIIIEFNGNTIEIPRDSKYFIPVTDCLSRARLRLAGGEDPLDVFIRLDDEIMLITSGGTVIGTEVTSTNKQEGNSAFPSKKPNPAVPTKGPTAQDPNTTKGPKEPGQGHTPGR